RRCCCSLSSQPGDCSSATSSCGTRLRRWPRSICWCWPAARGCSRPCWSAAAGRDPTPAALAHASSTLTPRHHHEVHSLCAVGRGCAAVSLLRLAGVSAHADRGGDGHGPEDLLFP